jgi:predicted aminopeptidase
VRNAISRISLSLCVFAVGIAGSGCYLSHVAAGQTRLLLARQPIDVLLGDATTPPELRDRLVLVSQVRDFAGERGLQVGTLYTHYAPWPGDRIVTTVVATRPGHVDSEDFWFPIVGRVPYKGYFDAASAGAEATRLRADGLDVCEVRVPAYSTLGWFDDPVTGPMLREAEPELVETLFHELVHASFFVRSDASLNEGLASFLGEELRVRFFAKRDGAEAGARERQRVALQRSVRAQLVYARDRAQQLYAEQPEGAERDAARAALDAEIHAQLAALPDLPPAARERMARIRTNDACLALAATYSGDTPCLATRLDALGGDLDAFIAQARAAAGSKDPRTELLAETLCTGAGPHAADAGQSTRSSSTPKYST